MAKTRTFSLTKPSFEHERLFHELQHDSLNILIACGLAERIGQNKYSLTQTGLLAEKIGLKKWAKSNSDSNQRELILSNLGSGNKWYHLTRIKIGLERITNSTISRELWFIIRGVLMLLFAYILWAIFQDSIINLIANNMG